MRILVDGYSCLHQLACAQAGQAASFRGGARGTGPLLTHTATQSHAYHGHFRRRRRAGRTPKADRVRSGDGNPLFKGRRTADVDQAGRASLERVREVLVVTTITRARHVLSLGGMASSCLNFIQTIETHWPN